MTFKMALSKQFSISEHIDVYKHDRSEFNFDQLVLQHLHHAVPDLGITSLEGLHNELSMDLMPKGVVTTANDQDTGIHKVLYGIGHEFRLNDDKKYKISGDHSRFVAMYRKFVRSIEAAVFQEPIVFQRLPTFRVHLVGNKSVGSYHVDSEYNHPTSEVNVWVPLTHASDTSSIFIETAPGRRDYIPLDVDVGQCVVFNSQLHHGNEVNTTGATRVSFDFRVIPRSSYASMRVDDAATSVSKGKKFIVGDYYDEF